MFSMSEVKFVTKIKFSRTKKKLKSGEKTYIKGVITVPAPILPLLDPDKEYIVIIKELKPESSSAQNL